MGLFDRRDDTEIISDLLAEAEESPTSVDVGQAISLLEGSGQEIQRGAAAVVGLVAQECPEKVAPYSEQIVAQLSASDVDVREYVSHALRSIVRIRTDIGTRHIETIAARLSDESIEVRKNAIRAFSHISDDDPDAVSDYADSIADLLTEDDVTSRQDAVSTLRRIAEVTPEKIKPYVPDVEAQLTQTTDAIDETVINQAIHTLGVVAEAYPGAVRYSVDEVAAYATDDSKKTRTNVSLVFARVAKEHPESVRPDLDAIAGSLTDSHDIARNNTIIAFKRVAKEYPETVQPYADRIRDLAENDPYEDVKRNAGHCISTLDENARSDSSQKSETQVFDPDNDL